MNTDNRELHSTRKAVEADIRELKSQLRSTWTREMWKEQRQLLDLQREATEIYVTLAWLRGKVHLQSIPTQHMHRWFGYRWQAIEYTPETLCEDLAQKVLDSA